MVVELIRTVAGWPNQILTNGNWSQNDWRWSYKQNIIGIEPRKTEVESCWPDKTVDLSWVQTKILSVVEAVQNPLGSFFDPWQTLFQVPWSKTHGYTILESKSLRLYAHVEARLSIHSY